MGMVAATRSIADSGETLHADLVVDAMGPQALEGNRHRWAARVAVWPVHCSPVSIFWMA
jgi:hypothetical protein